MQGNLDYPPMIISVSRKRAAGFLALCAGFLTISILLHSAIFPITFTLFSAGTALWAYRLLAPNQLVLTPAGLEVKRGANKGVYPWPWLSNFNAESTRFFEKRVQFDVRTAPNAQPRRVALHGGWEVPSKEVCNILWYAQQRWGSYLPPPAYPAQPAYPPQYPAQYPPQYPPQ